MNKKKLLTVAFACLLPISLVACEADDGVTKAKSVNHIKGKMFSAREEGITDFAQKDDGEYVYVDIYTIDGVEDIFYADVLEYLDNGYMPKNAFDDKFDCQNGAVFTLGEEGERVIIDLKANTIKFEDYTHFINSGVLNQLDNFNEMFQISYESKSTGDYSYTINLSDYGIKAYKDPKVKGKYYLPYQTLIDVLWYGNGEFYHVDERGIFYGRDRTDFYEKKDGKIVSTTGYGQFYYDNVKSSWSQAFADFQYNELCLALDVTYGLSGTYLQGKKANEVIKNTKYFEGLHSTNPKTFDVTFGSFLMDVLDDVHTVYQMPCPNTGLENFSLTEGPRRAEVRRAEEALTEIRDRKYKDIDYVEVGDTAFINIEEISLFALPAVKDANREIKREKSPIKNVVVDFSQCPGGAVVDGMSIGSWMAGSITTKTRDTFTGAYVAKTGKFDMNSDRVWDEYDTVSDLNVYAIISHGSFSCGNLIPFMCQENGNVKLIGQKSGGGSCAIYMTTVASGSMYILSSRSESMYGPENALVSVDGGATPDIPVEDESKLVDYEYIAELVHQDLAK